jgi:hypothetical protein
LPSDAQAVLSSANTASNGSRAIRAIIDMNIVDSSNLWRAAIA